MALPPHSATISSMPFDDSELHHAAGTGLEALRASVGMNEGDGRHGHRSGGFESDGKALETRSVLL